ncbi:MAG TPA: pyridoxamine 5'-phosphate oxidase family protein [Gemmatimonas sp.]|uniref:pyridoxamine 5'-phosphate oxidase family protein n=1 Tax=Gemmatimonas sp. TaxID=1962908 RepID=UPI002EDB5904
MSINPQFHVLNVAECEALLAAHHVGRLAYTFRDRLDIAPVHYVYRDGWIYGRTGPGAKMDIVAHHPWVAFEVDEVDALFRWRSVVVHGRIEILDPDGTPHDRERYEIGLAAVRSLSPAALLVDDPSPHRDIIFRLPTSEMTGRAATDDSVSAASVADTAPGA